MNKKLGSGSAVLIAASLVLFGQSLMAEVQLLSPAKDAIVALIPKEQKEVMNLPTYDERLALLKKDRASDKRLRHCGKWQKAQPVVLKWRDDIRGQGPWKVLIGKKADLSDARVWYLKKGDVKRKHISYADAGKSNVVEATWSPSYGNFEIATRYYWQVAARGRCSAFNCGVHCSCKEHKTFMVSPVNTFVTEDFAPRWIAIEGHTHNIRDIGGRVTADGRRVRQGMAYRGQGLNDNSATGERRGRNRLTVEDVEYFTRTLGVKVDLDLRSKGEIGDMTVSPLGPSVRFEHHSAHCYGGIFTADGKRVMAEVFRLFCDEKNYPIYFHCIGGADRTGSLGYVLNGVLGVSRHELETDWEETFYPTLAEMDSGYKDHTYWKGEWYFTEGFAKFGTPTSTWQERIVLYLKSCGITDDEIAKFRKIMLTDK